MKVDQQAHGNFEQAKVRKQLRHIDWMHNFLTLSLDDHPAFDDNICAKTAVQLHGVVYQRNRLLPFDAQAELRDFVC